MAHILIMPRQGNTVESCIIVDWKVKEGDTVSGETAVCEVETDKASFEVNAGAPGKVLKILRQAGDDVPVLEPIAVIGAEGEEWQSAMGGSLPPGSEAAASPPPPSAGATPATPPAPSPGSGAAFPPAGGAGTPPAISPRARNLAARESLKTEELSGSGPGGRIIERDIQAALQNRPLLSAAAKALGPQTIPAAGSGIGGRVTSADLAAGTVPPAARSPFPVLQEEGQITETPIKGIRKVIADRMFKSLAESAQFTLSASAPAGRLQEIRSRMKTPASGLGAELELGKITVNDLILFAVSRLLPRYPFMNAHKTGDILKTFERVHMGVAVDTPRGLMVPVIRNANLLSLGQISSEAKRLAAACQSGSAKPDELSGSTFTVTNLGSLGITSFTPVLNEPEVAILGVCGIELKPLAGEGGDVRFEPHIGFSLTINHQVVDGAPAARFLKALCEAMADIDLLFAAG
jgi:pyruvate dehydrogenase E2 component (dihydrolipoamide acetyltransferase)